MDQVGMTPEGPPDVRYYPTGDGKGGEGVQGYQPLVEYYEFCYLRTYQVVGQVKYDPIPPPKREFPVPHPNRILQSQGGKRVFPVVA